MTNEFSKMIIEIVVMLVVVKCEVSKNGQEAGNQEETISTLSACNELPSFGAPETLPLSLPFVFRSMCSALNILTYQLPHIFSPSLTCPRSPSSP